MLVKNKTALSMLMGFGDYYVDANGATKAVPLHNTYNCTSYPCQRTIPGVGPVTIFQGSPSSAAAGPALSPSSSSLFVTDDSEGSSIAVSSSGGIMGGIKKLASNKGVLIGGGIALAAIAFGVLKMRKR